jgi:hypothetical protein
MMAVPHTLLLLRRLFSRYVFVVFWTFVYSPGCSQIMENFDNKGSSDSSESETYEDPEDSEIVREAKKSTETTDFSYAERDVILYNLGIGATEQELQWTFEGDDQFSALPTFGVIPQFLASSGIALDFLPNFNPVCLNNLTINYPQQVSIGEIITW